ILHLIYSRFWTKVMRDLGLIDWDEPVTRLFPQGMVHKDGEVMSKSKGNTVAPDDVIRVYGAHTLRLYILSVAPPELPVDWSPHNTAGSPRLATRVGRFGARSPDALARDPRPPPPAALPEPARALHRKVHQTILKVTSDIEERIQLNTAVAAFHELANEMG